MIEVTLTEDEIVLAAHVGVRRCAESLVKGRRQAAGDSEPRAVNAWQQDVEGAIGEMAFAKALGRYWNGSINNFRDGTPDVGDVQVRTRSKDWYDLIVRDHERDDDVFVLVTGIAPTYRVIGAIRGRKAKSNPEWRQNHGGHGAAFFVPQSALKPVTAA